jgi:formylglycine-generating enzyme required for sulfatase activity
MKLRCLVLVACAAVACSKSKGKSKSDPRPSVGDAATTATHNSADAAPRSKLPPAPAPIIKSAGKGDCSTKYAPRPDRDPNPMCKVAIAGEVELGSGKSKARVTVSPFYIDQLEVTNALFARFLEQRGSHRGCGFANGRCLTFHAAHEEVGLEQIKGHYRARPGAESLPALGIFVEAAEEYCRWVGKRLPSEAEWVLAAYYDPKSKKMRRYPWGDRFEPGRANCSEKDCKDGHANGAPVGAFDGSGSLGDGSSAFGVYDVAGNADEWVADCYSARFPRCTKQPCRDPLFAKEKGCGSNRVSRGGDWQSGEKRLRVSSRAQQATAGFTTIGLRCARSAP